jgi:hypothetical protein
MNVDDTERAELIAALHQAATFAEGLLDLNERLLDALASGENRPDSEELDYLRAGLSRWREQLAALPPSGCSDGGPAGAARSASGKATSPSA